jgi:hypothetical protein
VYFEGGRGLNEEQLKDLFANARSEALERFDTEEQRIEEARRKHGEALAELNERLASGRLSRADYDHAVARLG